MSEPTPSTDLELARAASRGDARAADSLGERLLCISRFLAFRNQRMGRPLAADDLADATQEAVTIVWQRLGDFRGESKMETWCYAICHGVFRNAVRRLGRRTPSLAETVGEVVGEPDPATQDFDHVHRCLNGLAAIDAQIVRARSFEEREFDEIAAAVALQPAALKARYYRALAKLKECLSPYLGRSA